MASSSSNTLSLRSLLDKEHILTGTNFQEWYRRLRIVLRQERKYYVLETPLPQEPPQNASRAEKEAYKKHKDDSLDVQCIMLSSMSNELLKIYEDREPLVILSKLQDLYKEKARQERYEVAHALFT